MGDYVFTQLPLYETPVQEPQSGAFPQIKPTAYILTKKKDLHHEESFSIYFGIN